MATPIPSAHERTPRKVQAVGLSRAQDRGQTRPRPAGSPWRQPVLWLGALIFLASIAGCVLMIVLAMRYTDPPVSTGDEFIMKVPITRAPVDDAPALPASSAPGAPARTTPP
jgi:hypothetical protein